MKDCQVDISERVNIFDEEDFPAFVCAQLEQPVNPGNGEPGNEEIENLSTLNLGSTQDDNSALQQVRAEGNLENSQPEAELINISNGEDTITSSRGDEREEASISSGINMQKIQVEIHKMNCDADKINKKENEQEGKRKRTDRQLKVTSD